MIAKMIDKTIYFSLNKNQIKNIIEKNKNLMKKTIITLFILSIFYSNNIFAQRYWNTAAEFNGSNYIAVKPSTALNNLSGSFTAECWFNSTNLTGTQTLFGKDSFRLLIEPNGTDYVLIRVQTSGTTRLYSNSVNFTYKNQWNHLAVVYDSSSSSYMSIYINGLLDASISTANNVGPRPGNDSLYIGNSIFGGFKGMIDDIRIWDVPLSQLQIKTNMRNPYTELFDIYNPAIFPSGILLKADFENPAYGPSSDLFFFDLNNSFYNRGATPVDLGKNPSQTLVTNHALQVNGGNSYGKVANNPDINFNGPVTVEAWVYPKSLPATGSYYIVAKGSDYGFTLNNTGKVSFYSVTVGSSSATIPINQWSHIACRFAANGSGTCFINGIEDNTFNFGTRPTPGTNDLYIGASESTLNSSFNGYIDAVKISNYVKTQDEIKKEMFTILDNTNKPTLPKTTVSYDFEFQGFSSTGNSSNCVLFGSAAYTSPNGFVNAVPVSPLLGNNNANFPSGYLLRYNQKRIPETQTAGYTNDTLNVTSSSPISDLKLFIDLNHTLNRELQIKLYSPQGDSLIVYDQNYGISQNSDDIITIFSDAAELPLINGRYVSFSPTITPYFSSLNAKFGGRNPQGKWRLQITDLANGNTGVLYSWGLRINNSVDVRNISTEVPSKFNLSQNYPNPFNPTTKINFSVNKKGIVQLKVYDITGKQVAELVNENLSAGIYQADFNGTDFSSGVYYYKLITGGFTETKKMMLVK